MQTKAQRVAELKDPLPPKPPKIKKFKSEDFLSSFWGTMLLKYKEENIFWEKKKN